MKYDLVGVDGNAFSVMGYVLKAMKECGMSKEEQSDYQTKAMSGDYNNLLAVSVEMIDKCNEICGEDE
jgi:hypothetical protein